MLDDIFYIVLNMSITSIFIGIMVYLIRYIKAPKFLIYILWVIPFARLTLPFLIASKFSVMNLVAYYATKTVTVWEYKDTSDFTFTNYIGVAKSYFPITYKTNLLQGVFETAALVWIIVAVALIIAVCMMYFLTIKEIKNAVHISDNIYISDIVLTPTVYGIITQKIVMPNDIDLDNENTKFILSHEMVHVKRHDNFWRLVGIYTACIHWFNPFSWIMLKTFFSDMELACDSKVIKSLDKEKKKEYAKALVRYSAREKVILSTTFSGNKVKVRVKNILNYKKITAISALSFVIFLIAVAVVLLTNSIGG